MVDRALMDGQEFASSNSWWKFFSCGPGYMLSARVSVARAIDSGVSVDRAEVRQAPGPGWRGKGPESLLNGVRNT